MSRRQVSLGRDTIEVLDVPYVTQRPHVMYCVVAALKMAWDFIRARHGEPVNDDAAPRLSFDNIAALTRVDPFTGVQVSEALMERFNGAQGLVEATLQFGLDLDDLATAQHADLPVIAFYYPSMCENPGTTTSGVSHACVYLGATKREVLIHNPWFGPHHTWPAGIYEDARIPLGQAAITFTRVKQQKLELGESQEEE